MGAGNQRRYVYAALAVLGCVAILGTAATMTAKTREPIFDHARVKQMIQESATHKFTRSLSSTCQQESEKRMISAISVALLKEAVCENAKEDGGSDSKDACDSFTRVARQWEDDFKPPCSGDDLKCTKDDDSICIHSVCKDDIDAIPADERPTCA